MQTVFHLGEIRDEIETTNWAITSNCSIKDCIDDENRLAHRFQYPWSTFVVY